MAKLICQSGAGSGHEYPLTKDINTLGRLGSCNVQVLDTRAGSVHCQIRRYGRLYSLVDLGSAMGTLVNGKRVTDRLLTYGDRIRVADVDFDFTKEDGEPGWDKLLTGFTVQGRLGEGSMGAVFKGVQHSTGRVVALKILAPRYAARPRFIQQFDHESKAALTLDHPNIIRVFAAGREDGINFFAMELVEGPTCLQELQRRGPLPIDEALDICRQTALGLAHLHSRRLIHRDIKPDNLVLTADGVVKVVDLGVSAPIENTDAGASNATTRVAGTPFYLAPEMVQGGEVDHRVDLYSLGATLFHLLSGRPPFGGNNAVEIVSAHLSQPIPSLRAIRREVPAAVDQLVEKLLAKLPAERYRDADAVVGAINKLLEDPVVIESTAKFARPLPTTAQEHVKPSGGGLWLMVFLVVVLVAGTAAAVWLTPLRQWFFAPSK